MLILAVTWGVYFLATLFVLVCLLMMGVILIQKPRGGGLAGAFGGAGGSAQSPFGAKTGDFLTWFTVSCFVLFILLAISLVWTSRPPTAEADPANTTQAPANAPAVPPVDTTTPPPEPAVEFPDTQPTTQPAGAPATPETQP
jgi:preprotein translocase subunit SecG